MGLRVFVRSSFIANDEQLHVVCLKSFLDLISATNTCNQHLLRCVKLRFSTNYQVWVRVHLNLYLVIVSAVSVYIYSKPFLSCCSSPTSILLFRPFIHLCKWMLNWLQQTIRNSSETHTDTYYIMMKRFQVDTLG